MPAPLELVSTGSMIRSLSAAPKAAPAPRVAREDVYMLRWQVVGWVLQVHPKASVVADVFTRGAASRSSVVHVVGRGFWCQSLSIGYFLAQRT